MPIQFNPPAPGGFGSYYAYGARQSDLADQQLRLQAQAERNRLDLGLADVSTRAAESDQRANVAEQDREQQRYFFEQQARNQAALQQAAFEHQAQQQAQRASLDVWANQQEMSNAEKMRLVRLNNSLGQVNQLRAAGQLTDDEYYDAVSKLQTGISPLQQKQEVAKTQEYKALAEQQQQRGQLESVEIATRSKFLAKTMGDRISYQLNPEVYAQVAATIPKPDPALAQTDPAAYQQADADRKRQIKEAVYRAPGGVTQLFEASPGKWEPLKHDRPERTDAFTVKDFLAVREHAAASVDRGDKYHELTPDQREERIRREMESVLGALGQAAGGGGFNKAKGIPGGAAGGQQPPPPQGDRAEAWEAGKEDQAKTRAVAYLTLSKKDQVDRLIDQSSATPGEKQTAKVLNQELYKMSAAGGGKPLPEQQQAADMIGRQLDRIIAARPQSAGPATAPPPPPAPYVVPRFAPSGV